MSKKTKYNHFVEEEKDFWSTVKPIACFNPICDLLHPSSCPSLWTSKVCDEIWKQSSSDYQTQEQKEVACSIPLNRKRKFPSLSTHATDDSLEEDYSSDFGIKTTRKRKFKS